MAEDQDEIVGSFEFGSCSEGYGVRFADFGAGGIQLTVTRPATKAPWWDETASAMLDSQQFDKFLCWASKTCQRPAMALPDKTLSCLERTVKSHRVSQRTERIFKKAIRVLKVLNEPTRAQRAFNR